MSKSDSPQTRQANLAAKLGLRNKVLPTKFATAQDDAAALPKYEEHMYNAAPVDSEAGRMHAPARAGANFDEKIYMLPESFNALRRELYDNWPALFEFVGHAMAFDAPRFLQLMDSALDTKTTFDSAKVDGISKKYLDLLRAKRGLRPLHSQSEKA